MGRLFLLVLVVSALVAVDEAEAQEFRPERPYRGLFASGVEDAEQLLTFNGAVGAGWDDNLAADALGRTDGLFNDVDRQFKGGLGTVSAGLSYSLNRDSYGFGGSATTTGRFYPSQGNRFIRRDFLSAGTSANLGGGFTARANVNYQPYSLYSMTPFLIEPQVDVPAPVNEDFPSSLEHYVGYGAGVNYSRRLTSRSTLSAIYEYGGREPFAETGRFDRHTAGGVLVHTLGKGLDLRLGYRYTVAFYEGSSDHRGHVIDAGVNYNRALSFSRRTSFSFSTGTTASQTAPNGSVRYWATGAARLYHEIGRTWTAVLSYDRGLQFTGDWQEPLFTDSASAGLRGSISRRVYAQLEARAMRGVGREDLDDGLVTYSALAGITYAVTRYINSGINYSYYNHEFGSDVSLPFGYAHDFNRRSIRAYVSVWAPLFERSRRP